MSDRRLLNSTELFASLPVERVERLRAKARDRDIAKGELLTFQGDNSSARYVVTEGWMHIATVPNARRISLVAFLN